ncbi:MAG TPA: ribose 5-phosphate isomerase B [Firmicutes bacterium]|uniref:Ribose 5-phosphate isomerase B n=1 Tax=Candidatus Fermentithermobacillus carboniphilus TaxID=3085328 RepID=A0AAT9LF17_9FIRM|nr:MAG: ribose 5-phosphate isomerase B [Candidatus Fermentithermobacillus carboniphilus]HHW18684.1 ribose 5-phosphate isomerase B [Candidatus Fermentithermobacillaceae bacterium]
MKLAIGSDHAGYRLKTEILEFLKEMGHEVLDFGTHSEDSVDYPDFALKVAESVRDGESELGVLVCGTGLGMAIAANKVPGIRAVTCTDTFSAHMAREHNDANVLCLGARVTGGGLARDIVKAWLEARFQGGRHERRLAKITDIERMYLKDRR